MQMLEILLDVYLCVSFTQVFGVLLSNRLNIVKLIPIKIIGLMIVKKVQFTVRLTVCSCHVTYAFQSESILYS